MASPRAPLRARTAQTGIVVSLLLGLGCSGAQYAASADREVDAIERRTMDEVINAIENDEFTLESALVTLESVTRRTRIDTVGEFFRLDYETSSIHAI